MTQYFEHDDIVDIRDLIARFEELESMGSDDRDDDEQSEFETLQQVLTELRSIGGDHQWRGDWYPLLLIEKDYFYSDYAEEFVKEVGDFPLNIPSYLEIDWEKTADNLLQDYSEIVIEGVDYVYR